MAPTSLVRPPRPRYADVAYGSEEKYEPDADNGAELATVSDKKYHLLYPQVKVRPSQSPLKGSRDRQRSAT